MAIWKWSLFCLRPPGGLVDLDQERVVSTPTDADCIISTEVGTVRHYLYTRGSDVATTAHSQPLASHSRAAASGVEVAKEYFVGLFYWSCVMRSGWAQSARLNGVPVTSHCSLRLISWEAPGQWMSWCSRVSSAYWQSLNVETMARRR